MKFDQIAEAYLGMISEEIRGWKHAGADLAKARSAINNTVSLVRLKKDGQESKLSDARTNFRSEEDARKQHVNMTELNPNTTIRHNLYVDGQLKEMLHAGKK